MESLYCFSNPRASSISNIFLRRPSTLSTHKSCPFSKPMLLSMTFSALPRQMMSCEKVHGKLIQALGPDGTASKKSFSFSNPNVLFGSSFSYQVPMDTFSDELGAASKHHRCLLGPPAPTNVHQNRPALRSAADDREAEAVPRGRNGGSTYGPEAFMFTYACGDAPTYWLPTADRRLTHDIVWLTVV